MNIDTTINVRRQIFNSVFLLSRNTGYSQNRIYNQLLKTFFRYSLPKHNSCGRIKYQKRDKNREWETFHICYSYDMYEKSNDMKKWCKMSVSHIIEFSFENYLNEALKELMNKNTDNYTLNYFSISSLKQGMLNFTIYWGFPDEKTIQNLMSDHPPG